MREWALAEVRGLAAAPALVGVRGGTDAARLRDGRWECGRVASVETADPAPSALWPRAATGDYNPYGVALLSFGP
eukprot:1634321-Prymnesium_polylepis.1